MSRVDEALRRAEEMARMGSLPSEPVAPDSSNVAELAGELFPIEGSEPRQDLPLIPVVVAPPVMTPEPLAEPDRDVIEPAATRPPLRTNGALLEHIDRALAEKIVIDQNMSATSREQYRRLAAALHNAQAERGLKVVMIASAVGGEGKTLTASNLSLTLSESYKRNVLLVDADLRRPTLHTIFGVDNGFGLSEGLAQHVEGRLPVQQVSERLAILTGGHPSSDPIAGLTSERMRRLLDEAREMFDWIIIDTPPVALMPDANLLSSMADAAVLVVKAESTQFNLVQRAVEAVGRQRIIGTVLNRAETPSQTSGYGYYNGYYAGRSLKT
jgi:capsular exopolysaccharide synthesis family protein